MNKKNGLHGLDLDQYVPALINRLSSKLSASASEAYRKALDLTVVEWRILVPLANGEVMTAQAIGSLVGQDKGPISRALRRLERKGLITIRSAEKGRRNDVSSTEAGKRLYQQSLPIAYERQRRLLDGLTEAQQAELPRLLRALLLRTAAVADIDSVSLVDRST
jgi:DNA-binding MarR family transcriptional regulator